MRQHNRGVLGRRPLARAVAAVGVALTLVGCGAGQITQTDTQQPAVNGSHAVHGDLAISDFSLAFPAGKDKFYPAGSDVPLQLSIANRGGKSDKLVAVKTAIASSVKITGDREIQARRALQVVVAQAAAGAAEASKEAEGHSEGTEVTETPEPAATTQPGEASATADANAESDSGEIGVAQIVLRKINRELRPGQTVQITLIFREAGEITFRVPIAAPSVARTAEPHEGEAGH